MHRVVSLVLFASLIGCGGDDDGKGADPGPSYESLVLSPAGGEYDLADDLHLVVPAGAVDADTTIEVRRVPASELAPILERRGVALEDLYGAVEGKPDGTTFNEPIVFSFPAAVDPGDFPILNEVDLVTGNSGRAVGASVMVDPDNDRVEITMPHFTTDQAERQRREDEAGRQYCEQYPCRCKRVRTKTNDKSVMCQRGASNCHIEESNNEVVFIDCGTTHQDRQLNIDASCEPKVTLNAGQGTISTQDQTDITGTAFLGCPSQPLPSQDLTLSVEGPATISDTSVTTGSDGALPATTLSSQEDTGTAKVVASGAVSFLTYSQTITFEGDAENNQGKTIEKQARGEVSVEIDDVPKMTVVADTQTFNTVEYATLTVTVSMGDQMSEGDVLFLEPEGLELVYDFLHDPMFMQTSNGSAEIRLQIYEPGTHQVTVSCTPVSLGSVEEVSQTITVTVDRFSETWNGTLSVSSPIPSYEGIIVYGTVDFDFSFTFTHPQDQDIVDEELLVTQNLTVASNADWAILLDSDAPSSPDVTFLLDVPYLSDSHGFMDLSSRTLDIAFIAEEHFYRYRWRQEGGTTEGTWSCNSLQFDDPFDLEVGMTSGVVNFINEEDSYTLTLSH